MNPVSGRYQGPPPPLPPPRPHCCYRPKNVSRIVPSAHISVSHARPRSVGLCLSVQAGSDNNLLSQQHQQEEWVFQYPVHTLTHPSRALHQEIEEEEGGGEHKKRANSQGQTGGETLPRSGQLQRERCARCAGGGSALGPVLNPVARNNKHPQLASLPRTPSFFLPRFLCVSFSLSLAGYAHDITASPPSAGAKLSPPARLKTKQTNKPQKERKIIVQKSFWLGVRSFPHPQQCPSFTGWSPLLRRCP